MEQQKPDIITIFVDCGCVQGVFTTLPAGIAVEVELLDFDNARVDAEDDDALDKARERLDAVEDSQRQIF